MSETILDKLEYLLKIGESVDNKRHYDAWDRRVYTFLKTAFDDNSATDFSNIPYKSWVDELPIQLGHIEGLIAKISSVQTLTKVTSSNLISGQNDETGKLLSFQKSSKVFIVHGHDIESKETVARFVQKIGLNPIILHEQASSGRTIIEKFEVYSDVGFAIVLLTPDDIGAAISDAANLKSRARQNVILELGYFMGKLSRNRVCALFKAGVEIPSDYQGVLYIELDEKGAWRTKLAQELVQAEMKIKLEGLLET